MSSQKEFIVGCIIGGVLGTLGMLAVPKRYLNGVEKLKSKVKKKAHLNGHVKHAIITKRAAVKKAISKKSVKRKAH